MVCLTYACTMCLEKSSAGSGGVCVCEGGGGGADKCTIRLYNSGIVTA